MTGRRSRRRQWLALGALLGACAPHAPQEELPAPLIPADEGPWYPSLARTDGAFDPAVFDDVASCSDCHAGAVHQWQASAHANASFGNPWYRTLVDDLRADQGNTASRHCGGCHDPLLLLSGRMDTAIEPGEPQALSGVTCLVCHSIQSATLDGNASYVLDTSPVPYPTIGDVSSEEAHRKRLAPDVLRTPALCATCHRGFLGPHTGSPEVLGGIDEPGQWRGSAWAGSHAQRLESAPVPQQACRDCHMPGETAARPDEAGPTIASHRFAGGHSALAAQVGDPAQLDAVRAMSERAALLDLWVEETRATVVIRNVGVGHRFPGGARDMKQVWVELRAEDLAGNLLGAIGEDGPADSYALQTVVLDEDGAPEVLHRVQRFRTLGWDHTIAARDARMFEVDLPAWDEPYRLVAVLRSARHRDEVRAFVCDRAQTPRARAFAEQARREGRPAIDGCADAPVLDLARASLLVAPDDGSPEATVASAGAARPEAARRYDRALAMLHLPSERLDELEPWIDAADPSSAALGATGLALQGRLEEALAEVAQVEAQVGPGPALDRIRALAYAVDWRWPEAAAAAARVVEGAPGDTAAWRELARARGSAGDARGSLEASRRGLSLFPRDLAMLRSQALALEALGLDPGAATAAWVRYQGPQDDEALKLACDQEIPGCFTQRQPVVRLSLAADPEP